MDKRNSDDDEIPTPKDSQAPKSQSRFMLLGGGGGDWSGFGDSGNFGDLLPYFQPVRSGLPISGGSRRFRAGVPRLILFARTGLFIPPSEDC